MQKKLWYCRVCGIGGDAANLVMRLNKVDFPAAVKFLADLSGVIPPSGGTVPVIVASKPPARPPEQPSGLPPNEASTLVTEASERLWGPGGEGARAYLRGRGLTDETIKERGLGYALNAMVPTKDDDRRFLFSGIVIPWRDGTRLTRIKIRRLDDGKPRYAEAYSDRPLIFPGPTAVRPGKPLIVCEGEFDCLLLGQQLPEASVITLGSASARTDPAVLSRMLSAPRWFVALDADKAGDSAASKFPARAIRVRPPVDLPLKDWVDVHREGANRVRYHWGRYLPMSKSWVQLEPKGDLA
jgi:DNA primase